MKYLAQGAIGAALCLVSVLPNTASANVVFTLTAARGTITLVDGTGIAGNGVPVGTVMISEELGSNIFAHGGNGDAIEFSVSGNATIAASDISNLQFTSSSAPASSAFAFDVAPIPKGTDLGGFQYGINCTACGVQATSPFYNDLVFDVTNSTNSLTIGDFIVGDASSYYFLSNIGVHQNNGDYSTGDLGALGFSGSGSGVPAPEPASIFLLGGGLVLLGFVTRRKQA